MAKFFNNLEDGNKSFWCPGCERYHGIDPKKWKITVVEGLPTVQPSILGEYYNWKYKKEIRCHSYIKNGKIQYLGDCGHNLKNRTVNMKELE
jgi:hypothetical protein